MYQMSLIAVTAGCRDVGPVDAEPRRDSVEHPVKATQSAIKLWCQSHLLAKQLAELPATQSSVFDNLENAADVRDPLELLQSLIDRRVQDRMRSYSAP